MELLWQLLVFPVPIPEYEEDEDQATHHQGEDSRRDPKDEPEEVVDLSGKRPPRLEGGERGVLVADQSAS
jgi:hypothetical protein